MLAGFATFCCMPCALLRIYLQSFMAHPFWVLLERCWHVYNDCVLFYAANTSPIFENAVWFVLRLSRAVVAWIYPVGLVELNYSLHSVDKYTRLNGQMALLFWVFLFFDCILGVSYQLSNQEQNCDHNTTHEDTSSDFHERHCVSTLILFSDVKC